MADTRGALIARLTQRGEETAGDAPAASGQSQSLAIAAATTFTTEVEAVRARVFATLQDVIANAHPGNRAETEEKLVSAAHATLQLQAGLAELSQTLPSYVRRQATQAIDALLAAVTAARAAAIPKKKFSFVRKPRAAGGAAVDAATGLPTLAVAADSATPAATAAPVPVSVGAADLVNASSSSPDVQGVSDAVIVLAGGRDWPALPADGAQVAVASLPPWAQAALGEGAPTLTVRAFPALSASLSGADVWLAGLTRCVVVVTCPLVAARVNDIVRCAVLLGPVAGSMHAERVSDSILAVACRQLRIHHTHRTAFYLATKSRPIVEDTTTTGFAPYVLDYRGVRADLAGAGIDAPLAGGWHTAGGAAWGGLDEAEESRAQQWAQVDDFHWHRVTKSPNWHIIPHAERCVSLPAPFTEQEQAP